MAQPNLVRSLTRIVRSLVRGFGGTSTTRPAPGRRGGAGSRPSTRPRGGDIGQVGLPDFTGRATITYEPHPDGDADPGEVVWTWVPYEDDPRQGKDRPVLIIARHSGSVLGLLLSSQDRAPKGTIRREGSRVWMDLGSGPWDSQGRPSDIRLDRVLVLDPFGIRREGAVLDRTRFQQVADAVNELKGW